MTQIFTELTNALPSPTGGASAGRTDQESPAPFATKFSRAAEVTSSDDEASSTQDSLSGKVESLDASSSEEKDATDTPVLREESVATNERPEDAQEGHTQEEDLIELSDAVISVTPPEAIVTISSEDAERSSEGAPTKRQPLTKNPQESQVKAKQNLEDQGSSDGEKSDDATRLPPKQFSVSSETPPDAPNESKPSLPDDESEALVPEERLPSKETLSVGGKDQPAETPREATYGKNDQEKSPLGKDTTKQHRAETSQRTTGEVEKASSDFQTAPSIQEPESASASEALERTPIRVEHGAPVLEARSDHEAESVLPSRTLDRIAGGRLASGVSERVSEASDARRIDPARFVSRVTGAFRAAKDQGGAVRLRLSPPELGSLQVKLSVQGGALSATIEAETSTARNVLLDNLPALREQLAGHDIRIEKFDVDVRQDSNRGQDWLPGERQSDSESRPKADEDTTENDPQGSRESPRSVPLPGAESDNINLVV